jgi:hypothetical protein
MIALIDSVKRRALSGVTVSAALEKILSTGALDAGIAK